MADHSIIAMGLPESGKSTFLAALWHLLIERDIDTVLKFHSLTAGETSYLTRIAKRWREAKVQDRTELNGAQVVSIALRDADDAPVQITFPDLPGEAYRRMWEERDIDPPVADLLISGAILLFVHADDIRAPSWVVDNTALSKMLGLPVTEGAEVPWHPRLAPTQVQLVSLLQALRQPPLDIGPRRIAVMLSAWDKAAGEGLGPHDYLTTKLPLLRQYLESGADEWDWRVYGLSAQGGDYDSIDAAAPTKPDAARLRDLDQPSKRIRLLNGAHETQDLTEPLAWLMAADEDGS
jgi:hypothetical protein